MPPVHGTKPIINKILKDLDVLMKNRNFEKRSQKSRELVIFIVSSLRRRDSDHLLQTTAIWALINICRVDADSSRYVQ
jgi:hypothetical protein